MYTRVNLSSLHVKHFTIDPLVEALTSLSSLDELKLYNCHIPTTLQSLKLRTLEVSGLNPPPTSGALSIASPATLRTLAVDGQISQLVAGFGGRPMQELTHLSVQVVREVEEFFSFLDRCPQLEALVVNGLYRGTTLPTFVHQSTLPRLNTLAGPPEFMQLLTPGRPVTAARVLGHHRVEDSDSLILVCADISRSSAPVQSLSLPYPFPSPSFFATVTFLFPDLKQLSMKIRVMEVFSNYSVSSARDGPTIDRTDLRDENAFEDIPEDEISDAEGEAQPPVILVGRDPSWRTTKATYSGAIQMIANWILNDELSLPRNLETLSMNAADGFLFEKLSAAEQHQVIAVLSGLCPWLSYVRFGPISSGWRRIGQVWKSEAPSPSIRIISEAESSITSILENDHCTFLLSGCQLPDFPQDCGVLGSAWT
ncbi:hypothetical protein B0H16DRAFT_1615063 [Mycena metata]|uniref:Uncharacterized protein n=1 Tax=Mycena metata TaxID=1033252 RepID=A0AAD7HAD4_9AGAR|nr:hypothetical protein B0H16DRAFT_1615063 [Mycena metata]